MNIFLADIRGLSLDLQAPAEIDSDGRQKWPDGAANSLESTSTGPRQVIEFNMFFDQLSPESSVADETVTALPGDAWVEYLANAPVRVTTDGEPALLRPAAVEAASRVTALATGPGFSATSGSAGGSLPPGGNSLPGPVTVAPPTSIATASLPAADPPPTATEAVASAIRAPLDAASARSPAPAGLESVPRGEAGFDTGRTTAVPVRPIDSSPAAQAGPAGAMRYAGGPELLVDVRPGTPAPVPATPAPQFAIAVKSSATVAPTDTNAFEPVTANASAQRTPATAAVQSAPVPGQDSRTAAPAEALAAPPGGKGASVEFAPAMSPRPAPAAPLPVNGTLDVLLADAPQMRGPETAAPTLSAGGSASAPPGMQATVLPAVNSTGLPAHLESLAIPRQAGAADWGNGLGERVSWMIDQRQGSATIRLDPPTLGKLDVQVRVADDATTITIQAQHAPTRELIEASATRLRDFLQESGFQNVNVDVSQRQDQQQARAQVAPDARDGADGAAPEPDHPGPAIADREAAGDGVSLVDTFA